MSAELPIITRTYDIMAWTLPHVAKFARDHRYSLGKVIEDHLQQIFDDLVEAKFTHEKAEVLRRAALGLEKLRFKYRLATQLGLLPKKSHLYAIRQLDDINRQLQGWRQAVERRNEKKR